jgi:glucose-6-phosphate-specific signal transduction histidine kinase
VEVAASYVVSEALTNAAKHAHASVVHIDLRAHEGHVHLSVRDDGAGGTDPSRGSGLNGLSDRVQALVDRSQSTALPVRALPADRPPSRSRGRLTAGQRGRLVRGPA